MKMDKDTILEYTFVIGCTVYVVFFLVALFAFILPFAFSDKFMIMDTAVDPPVFRWFATGVPQIERDAFMVFLIMGVPAFCVIVGSTFAFGIKNLTHHKGESKQ